MLVEFRTGCEIDFPQLWFCKGLRNSFSSISQGLQNFTSSAKFIFQVLLSVLQLIFLLVFRNLAKISNSHAKLLDVRFLLWFSSLHTWLIWKRLRSSPKLGFFMCLSLILLCHGLCTILPHSWLDLMIKNLSKTPKLAKNWLETFARVLNVPIELKGNKYYSKVFKRVTSYKRALFE